MLPRTVLRRLAEVGKVRVGVVLLLPPPDAAAIDALRRACGDRSLGLVAPHVTLVPPVNVRDDRLGDAADVLAAAARVTRPFTVQLGPAATFEPANSVLHLPVVTGAAGGLDALKALRDMVFVAPLSRPLQYEFVPHVTLAEEAPGPSPAAAAAVLSGFTTVVTFDRVHLLEERPGPDGRVWMPAGEWAFGGPAVVGRGGLEVALAVGGVIDREARAFSEREWPLQWLADHGPAGVEGRAPLIVTARREGQVVGLAEGWSHGGLGFLGGLIVGAGTRGEGVGTHVLAAFEAACRARRAKRLALQAMAGSSAVGFYERRGWRVEAVLANWVHGSDRVIMRRDLP